MRFLKNKIRKAKEALERSHSSSSFSKKARAVKHAENNISVKLEVESTISTSTACSLVNLTPQVIPKRKRSLGSSEKKDKPDGCKSTKNIVINYGKAIAGFACSEIALPYLNKIIVEEGVTLQGFLTFATHAKEAIGGIASFRSLLVINEGDSEELSGFKRSLKKIAVVFIKFFSVNWIFHGRVIHKSEYLKYRFRMLRRVQDAENFTYIR